MKPSPVKYKKDWLGTELAAVVSYPTGFGLYTWDNGRGRLLAYDRKSTKDDCEAHAQVTLDVLRQKEA